MLTDPKEIATVLWEYHDLLMGGQQLWWLHRWQAEDPPVLLVWGCQGIERTSRVGLSTHLKQEKRRLRMRPLDCGTRIQKFLQHGARDRALIFLYFFFSGLVCISLARCTWSPMVVWLFRFRGIHSSIKDTRSFVKWGIEVVTAAPPPYSRTWLAQKQTILPTFFF